MSSWSGINVRTEKSKAISAKDLLREAETLKTQPGADLVDRVRQLRQNLRNTHGLATLEPDYHRAAKIYSEYLLPLVSEYLPIEELGTIGYNQNLL